MEVTLLRFSERSQRIVTDEDENRKIAAEALKRLDEVKNFIEVNGRDHLDMIFDKLIENVVNKAQKPKQSDTRSFFRPKNMFYLYCLLLSYEKHLPS